MFQVDRVRILPLVACTQDFLRDLFDWALHQHEPNANFSQLNALKKAARRARGPLGELASQPNSNLPNHMATLAGSPHLLAIKDNYEDITRDYQDFLNRGAPETLVPAAKTVADEVFRYLYVNLLDQATYWKKYPSSNPVVTDKKSLRSEMGMVHPICPYCDLVKVADASQSTVDHFLAQDHFPVLAIYGENLLAACYSCNLAIKNATYIGTRPTGEAVNVPIFHPLFHQAADHLRFRFNEEFAPISLDVHPRNSNQIASVVNFTTVFGLQSKYGHYKDDMNLEVQKFLPQVRKQFRTESRETGRCDLWLLKRVLTEVARQEYCIRWELRGRVDKTKLLCDFYRFLHRHIRYFAKDLGLIR